MEKIIIILALLRDAISRYRHVILRLAVALIVALALGSALFYTVEKPRHEGVNFFQTIWSVFFTMVSGDFVEIKPTTAAGRLLVTLLIFFGIGFVSVVTATIASALVVDKIKEGKGMKALRLRNHFLICGWNAAAPTVLASLRAAKPGKHVVIIANLAECPEADADEKVHFICGDCTEEGVLRRAAAAYADTALVLADYSGGRGRAGDLDARTILAVLTLETINRNIYTCAELINPKNRVHLERVHADEVVISGEYAGKVLATAAVAHGISAVVNDLLTVGEGAEFYKIPVPAALAGVTFDDALGYFREKCHALPVAVMRGGEAVVNPAVGFALAAGDELFVIATEEPRL